MLSTADRPSVLIAVLLATGMACGGAAARPEGDDPARARPAPAPARPAPAAPASARSTPAPAPPAEDASGRTLVVEGLLNPGFEWIADDTTEPPKYGAYWRGAFADQPGDATDLVLEGDDAFEGRRWLRLPAGTSVVQKIVADERTTDRLAVSLAWRARGSADLAVTLLDGTETSTRVVLDAGTPGGRDGRSDAGSGSDLAGGGLDAPPAGAAGRDGWTVGELELGAAFLAEHGRRPQPRLELHLAARGEFGHVEVDAVHAAVVLPRLEAPALDARIRELAEWTFHTWFEGRDAGGLGLVDPATGYVRVNRIDVETGEPLGRPRSLGFHTIHTALVLWLREAHARGWDDEIARWTPHLQRIVRTLLDRHFDEETGLPRSLDAATGEPQRDQPQDVGAWVFFLADALPLLPGEDEATARELVRRIRTIADTLIRLQREHDLDPERVPNRARLNRATGVFEGTYPNWFGHIPNKLAPDGTIDTPRRYNTAWAIVKERTFWYHLLRSPAAIMVAHDLDPRPGDVPAVRRAVSRYDRDWDAARYDLENDTDDHYGYLCEDGLRLLRHAGGQVPEALRLVQEATDHRLPREAPDAGETLWIQGVRLGTPCAGDSPRAFKGVLDLYELPPHLNPVSSGLPLYREAILELAANDFKGRQLTNGQFTESFFADWEMVCICYDGTYQGDCRERPMDQWQGDVGDIFGGPPMSSIEAQAWACHVAGPDERPLILARLTTILDVTERTMRRPYGYLYGLDPAVARQYELPEKYVLGLSERTTRGLGYVVSWLRVLPALREDAMAPGGEGG